MMGGSPANSKISPEEMLRRHVDRILHRSAVPADQQGDLLEELCGHLWQRWRAEMESGLDADGAALAAIQSFGGPDELAVDMTRAFHGRLFATTIGVLLPAVVPPEGRPKGFTRSRALIGIVVAMWLALAPFQIWDGQWSLFQGFAGGLLAVFTLVMMVLAYQALGRQQWWARKPSR